MKSEYINLLVFYGSILVGVGAIAASDNLPKIKLPKLRFRARLRYWRMIKHSCFAAAQCEENGRSALERARNLATTKGIVS